MRRWAWLHLSARRPRARLALLPLAVVCAVLLLVEALWLPEFSASAAAAPTSLLAEAAGAVRAVAPPPDLADVTRTVAQACGGRPNFRTDTVLELDGRQRVIVSAGSGESLNSLTFGTPRPLQNALIDIGNLVGQRGTFTFPLPPSTSQVVFWVRPTASRSASPISIAIRQTMARRSGSPVRSRSTRRATPPVRQIRRI